MDSQFIDPDAPDTFPAAVKTRLAELTQMSDLEALESEAAFISSLTGSRLRAFHFSRLLPHEFDLVRLEGLRPFSRDLFTRRIQLAVHHGHLNDHSASTLMATSMYGTDDGLRSYFQDQLPKREGQVHACIGSTKFTTPSDFELLQGKWGGEGIYFAADNRMDPGPPQPGFPVLIELALRIDNAIRPMHFNPPLSSVLSRKEDELSGDVRVDAAVGAEEIVKILKPGDADYDQYAGLEQS
ncbi:hypothetical protein GCM10023346_48680 [Arthrobacter gyeryongensis]|uniref:Uncharacterized protein n=1 Tax=Arthrobacter gyeryongensis TaxID=1650592 RepID=A0ABP8VAE0_9MICC|nr:hypothetical protein [Paenarthrobacter sp. PAE-2]MCW3768891.1 hypothetical protein [Paenarthrobacter sp. PAE-2]